MKDKLKNNKHLYLNFPFKAFWVFLSGKEIIGRKRIFKPSNFNCMLVAMIWLIGGISGVNLYLYNDDFPIIFIILSTIFIVGGARYMVGTNIHMMSHNLLFSTKKANMILGEIFTTIFFIQSYQRYREDHLLHHGKAFGSFFDGDAKAVVQLGFYHKKTALQLWLHLFKLCIDPVFHYNFLKGRVRENLILCHHPRKILTLLWISFLVLIVSLFGFEIVLYSYIIPVIFLCQIAALLQLLCEHIWISTEFTSQQCHRILTIGRFCGVPFPSAKSKVSFIFDFICWMFRMTLIELPARIMILQGTLPSHDWHHRHGGNKKWADSAMLRELDVAQQSSPEDKTSYYEVWGFIEILDNVFINISQSEPYPELKDNNILDHLDYGDIK